MEREREKKEKKERKGELNPYKEVWSFQVFHIPTVAPWIA